MIPGFIITWITFPGVIVHELAHLLMCRLFGLDVYEVKYFQFTTGFGTPSGYVVHQRADRAWKDILVSVGPFLVNTILGAVISAPGALAVFRLRGGDVLDYFLLWLGVSIGMHAFPSTGDAKSIWSSITSPDTSIWTKLIGFPIVGLIYLGALGSMIWLDFFYGVAVANLIPLIVVTLLS